MMSPIDRSFPRHALVTGAGGFIGSYVAQDLVRRGCRVTGLGRSDLAVDMRRALGLESWVSGGVTADTLQASAQGAEVIFHCAGSGSVPLSLDQPAADFHSNVMATQAVLEFARIAGGLPVVLVSSAGVYGRVETLPIRVSAGCNPISPYGMNKQICEMLARQYGAHFGVPTVVVRLFSVYGERLRKQLMWDACHKLLKDDRVFFGTGAETRDWIHAEDAARLITAAAGAARVSSPVINGATGMAISIRTVIEGLAVRLGISAPIGFNGHVRPGDPTHYLADITEALDLGWRSEVDIEDGLSRYADWFSECAILGGGERLWGAMQ